MYNKYWNILKEKPKILLITGCANSGTSWVSSCVGRHSEINMLHEDIGYAVLKGVGKKYNANKLVYPRQIHWYKTASRSGYLIRRLLPNGERSRIPISKMSLWDYIQIGAKVIYVLRDPADTIESMGRWLKYSEKQAGRDVRKNQELVAAIKMSSELKKFYIVHYERFKNEKYQELVLREICMFLNIRFEPEMFYGSDYNWLYKGRT